MRVPPERLLGQLLHYGMMLWGMLLCGVLIALPARGAALESREPAHGHFSCPRPAPGVPLAQPHEITSQQGALRVSLTIRGAADKSGNVRYCYFDEHGNQAPTLRVSPGDMLYVRLRNEISVAGARAGSVSHDPCSGGAMTAGSTNLHFHGLAIAPVCHQDDTLKTLVQPGDPPFEYRVQIPKDQPPGLYWYHPHVHGFSEKHLLGGASGALIVQGIEKVAPRVSGLPERLFVIRDEWMPPAAPGKPDPNRPTKQLSVNYVPIPYPQYPTPALSMKPGQREFWRLLNASADTYIAVFVEFGGQRRNLQLVEMDGVPIHYGEPGAQTYAPELAVVFLPPAARAEVVVTSPAEAGVGHLRTGYVFRGADEDTAAPTPATQPPGVRAGQDDVDAARPLVEIHVAANATEPSTLVRSTAAPEKPRPPLSGVRPVRKRMLYFSERLSNPGDPTSPTLFFITAEGRTPAVFDPDAKEPDITVQQGDVEDWVIENRSREAHTFHIHQLHFLVISGRGTGWEEPTERDTVNVPGWGGYGRYPRLTLRMDFRDPHIVGTIPFHCHIAQHLDGGMMGTVRIEPAVGRPPPGLN